MTPFSFSTSIARCSSAMAASGSSIGIEAKPLKREGCAAISSAYLSFTIFATSTCAAPSAKKTFGVDNERIATSMPARSISVRRSVASVIGAVTPKNREPRYRMIVCPDGSVPNEKSPPLRSMSEKYAVG